MRRLVDKAAHNIKVLVGWVSRALTHPTTFRTCKLALRRTGKHRKDYASEFIFGTPWLGFLRRQYPGYHFVLS
jgi:hypothetical protein